MLSRKPELLALDSFRFSSSVASPCPAWPAVQGCEQPDLEQGPRNLSLLSTVFVLQGHLHLVCGVAGHGKSPFFVSGNEG